MRHELPNALVSYNVANTTIIHLIKTSTLLEGNVRKYVQIRSRIPHSKYGGAQSMRLIFLGPRRV